MNKKLWFTIYTSVFLAIVTVVLCVIIIPRLDDIFDDGKPKLIIEEVSCDAGETIEVPVVLKNNPGTWGAQIIVDYDSNVFSFVSADVGNVYDNCSINVVDENKSTTHSVVLVAEHKNEFKNNKVHLINSTENGQVVVLKFMVKVGAKKGEHTITINKDTNFCDKDAKLVDSIMYKDGIIDVD